MKALTTDTFSKVLENNKYVVVDYWAEWCEKCIEMLPIVEELSDEYPHVTFAKVNVDEQPQLKTDAKIKAIPMLLFYKEGKPVSFAWGLNSKETIKNKIEQLIG